MRRVVVALVFAASLKASAASADPAAEAEAARLNDEGKTLFRARKDAEAVDLFKRAYARHAKPGYLFNIGLAAEQLDLCPTALAAFARYLELTAKSDEAAAPAKQRQAAASRASDLGKRCKSSDEFAATDAVTSDGSGGGDGSGNAGDAGDGDGLKTPEVDPPAHAEQTGVSVPWTPLTIGGGVAVVGVLGYAIYQVLVSRGLVDDAERIAMEQNITGPPGSNLCDQSGVSAELDSICNRGERAARRASISFIVAGGLGAATAALAYMAFIRKPSASPRAGEIETTAAGPGDVGFTMRVHF